MLSHERVVLRQQLLELGMSARILNLLDGFIRDHFRGGRDVTVDDLRAVRDYDFQNYGGFGKETIANIRLALTDPRLDREGVKVWFERGSIWVGWHFFGYLHKQKLSKDQAARLSGDLLGVVAGATAFGKRAG